MKKWHHFALQLLYAKNLVFKKWLHFENWPFCKGYSKAKWSIVVYFGSELQRAKSIQKRLCNHITVLLCKNRLKNTLNVRQITRFWKVTKMVILLSKAKRSKTAYLSLNFKVSKHSKNGNRTTFKSFYAKKGLKSECP